MYSSGFLWFVRGGTLFAQAFDDRAMRTTGGPMRVADGVGYQRGLGFAAITVSENGVLAHGTGVTLTTSLRWRDRVGAPGGSPTPPGVYRSPRLSPDQKSVAMALNDAGSAADVWVLDLARGGHVTCDDRSGDRLVSRVDFRRQAFVPLFESVRLDPYGLSESHR